MLKIVHNGQQLFPVASWHGNDHILYTTPPYVFSCLVYSSMNSNAIDIISYLLWIVIEKSHNIHAQVFVFHECIKYQPACVSSTKNDGLALKQAEGVKNFFGKKSQ